MSVKILKPGLLLVLGSEYERKVLMLNEGILDSVGKRINYRTTIY